ncbi:presenilin enhancer 2 [Pseudoscourfieldia marina]
MDDSPPGPGGGSLVGAAPDAAPSQTALTDEEHAHTSEAPQPQRISAGVLTCDGDLNFDMSLEEAKKQAFRLFVAGFAGLPALWLVNAWMFWPAIRRRASLQRGRYQDAGDVAYYATASFALGVVTSVCFSVWTFVFLFGGVDAVGARLWSKLSITRQDLGLEQL